MGKFGSLMVLGWEGVWRFVSDIFTEGGLDFALKRSWSASANRTKCSEGGACFPLLCFYIITPLIVN